MTWDDGCKQCNDDECVGGTNCAIAYSDINDCKDPSVCNMNVYIAWVGTDLNDQPCTSLGILFIYFVICEKSLCDVSNLDSDFTKLKNVDSDFIVIFGRLLNCPVLQISHSNRYFANLSYRMVFVIFQMIRIVAFFIDIDNSLCSFSFRKVCFLPNLQISCWCQSNLLVQFKTRLQHRSWITFICIVCLYIKNRILLN